MTKNFEEKKLQIIFLKSNHQTEKNTYAKKSPFIFFLEKCQRRRFTYFSKPS